MIHLKPAHRELAKRPRSANAIRLYWWLSFELDYLEYKAMKIARMARGVGMDKSNVVRAVRTLRDYNLIQRNGKVGPRGAYAYRLVLNPQDPTLRETTTDSRQ